MLSLWRLATLVAAGLVGGGSLFAQESGDEVVVAADSTAVPLRQVYVPADDPKSWPAGDWIPVSRKELGELLARPDLAEPSGAYLENAVYKARAAGTTLVGGTLEAICRLRDGHPQFVDLGTPSLAISRLHWSGRDAVWGLADDGRSLLRVEEDTATLSGRWSLAGRRVFATIEFDVRVPPATVTQLELELPASRELTIDRGLISRVTDSQREGWKTWHVDLGRRTSCRLTVSPAGSSSRQVARELQISQTSTYSFVDSDLRIQSDITIQSVVGEFETLDVVAPPAMTFSSITAGNDMILPAWRKQEQQRSVLVVDVSGLRLGSGTRLRLRGQVPIRPGSRQGLPRLGLVGAKWLQLRRQVRVVSPLHLKDLEMSDSRLVNSSMSPDSGAVLEFEDLSPTGQIRVNVDIPQPELSAQVLSRVDWQQADPQLRTDLSIEAQTGSTYSLVCDVPTDWEVTRVDAGSATPVAQWQTIWDADTGRNQLHVEFRNALSAQSPVRLSILARPRTTEMGPSVAIPAVTPVVSGERRVAVVISPPPEIQFEVPTDSDYQAIDLADLVAERPELGEEFTEIGASGLLVLQASDPDEEGFLRVLRAADGDGEPTGPASDGPRETAGSPVPEAPTGVTEPIHAPLEVFTVVAAEQGGLCRNRVILRVPPVGQPRTLRLQLPEAVRLLTAKSNSPLNITDRAVVVDLPPVEETTEVTLSYECPLQHSLLSGRSWIPLPQWDGEPTTIGWQIALPQSLRLLPPTDGSTALATPALTWSQRILGPLGRSAGETLFWPFSASTWRVLTDASAGDGTDQGEYRRMHRSLAGEREALRLAFWDVAAARRVGWCVLLISLLIASWPFQRDRLLRPGWTLKLVLIGIGAALLSPAMLAIPWGGFVVGASIGALLPERWRTPRRREISSEASTSGTRTLLPLSATMGVLLVNCLIDSPPCHGWQVAAPAADISTSPVRSSGDDARLDVLIPLNLERPEAEELPAFVYVDRAAAQRVLGQRIKPAPRYLLRSAEYEMDELDVERPTLAVRYDVVLLQPASETRVVLALTGVQFPDPQLCRVDGVAAPLLPHRSGDGVVVMVAAGTAAEDGQEASVQIELVCQPRPAAGEQNPQLALEIPKIIASVLTLEAPDPAAFPIAAVHAGQLTYRNAHGHWRVMLGGQGHLVLHAAEAAAAQRWPEPVSAASVVEAHPMRLRIDSRLTFRTRPQWARLEGRTLRLQLPAGSILRDIRAEGLQHTRTDSNGRSPLQIDLLFAEDLPEELNIEISFDLPATRLEEGSGIAIPPLPFLADADKARFSVHRLGVAAAPGFRLTAADPQVTPEGTPDAHESQLPAWRGPRMARTADAVYELTSPRGLEIPLAPVMPSVSTSVRQTLTVRSAMVEWAATLQMSIRDAPLALHRLQIDPRINVRQVMVTQETVERLATWSRTTPDELVLFLKEELGGAQTVQLKGSLAVDDRYDFVIPSLAVEGAALVEPPEVVVQHAAGIPVVVAADDGTVVAGDADAASTQDVVQLATLNHDPTLPPLRIQRERGLPILDVEQMTIIEALQQAEARWTRLIRISTSRIAQDQLTIEVAATPPQIQAAASVPMTEEVDDGTTRLSLDLSGTESETVELTLTGRTPLSPGRLPEVLVAGAPVPQHQVVILEGVEVAVEGGQEIVDRAGLPAWVVDNLNVLERPAEMVLTVADGPVRLTPSVDASADAWLQRLDTAIWLQSDGLRRGVTVADITALRQTVVEFAIPDGMTLQIAELDGARVVPAGSSAFEIPAAQMPQRLILWWTDETSVHEGLPLPAPSNLGGAPVRAVLFGTDRQLVLFDESLRRIPAAELLEDSAAQEDRQREVSPITQALRAAGVETGAKIDVPASVTTHAVQMTDQQAVIPVHLIDRQLAGVLGLLLAAAGVLFVWFIVGRWSDRLLAAAQHAAGFPSLVVLAAAVWLLGISWLGLLLLVVLISLWVSERRRLRAQSIDESRLQSAH